MAGKRQRNYIFTLYPFPKEMETEKDFQEWDPQAIDWLHFKPAVQFIICQLEECPKTGRIHWQGYIEFLHPQSFQAAIKSFNPFKPHIEIRKGTAKQATDYCSKTESCVDPDCRFEWGKARDVAQTKDEIYRAALACESMDEAITYLIENAPRDFVMHSRSIKTTLRDVFQRPETNPWFRIEFTMSPIDRQKLETYAIILYGISNTGKTSYALSHFKQPLLVRHVDDLKMLQVGTDGIVFDDMSFKHWPRTACIHILDLEQPSSIQCRYAPAKIPAKMPRIFTTNESFEDIFNFTANNGERLADALYRRTKRYHVITKLYDPTKPKTKLPDVDETLKLIHVEDVE